MTQRVHVVYFTCSNHFNEFKASLNSVRTVASSLGNIYAYIDVSDPLTNSQIDQLKGIIVRNTQEPIGWGGTATIESELMAYNGISLA